jgi:hypothetical protein
MVILPSITSFPEIAEILVEAKSIKEIFLRTNIPLFSGAGLGSRCLY